MSRPSLRSRRPGHVTWRLRHPGTGDDAGAALIISLLTIMVATSLSVLVLGSVVSQLGPAQFNMKNTRTAHAAEAGLDTALGTIRTAVSVDPSDNTSYVGDRRLLPCTPGTSVGQVSGDLAGSPGALSYAVTISYFTQDPAKRDATWRAAHDLACSSSGSPAITPVYALLSSTGTGSGVSSAAGADVASRTLETIYNFNVTDENVLGGLIHNYFDGNAATRDLCFDAGSDAPAAGAALVVRNCDPGSAQQLFSWRPDYSIVLSATQGTAAAERCVTAVRISGTTYASLNACDGSYTQKWGYTDSGGLVGQLKYNPPSSNSTTGYCLGIVSDNTPGSRVSAATGNCSGEYNRRSTWRPDARVGAGSAGNVAGPVQDIPMQWVNFAEFGRCYDVTNWTVGHPFMIAYPCKQEPTGYVGWNQTMVWAGPSAGGHLYTVAGDTGQTYGQAVANGGSRYCATAPTSNGGYVTMSACDGNEPRQAWTVNRETNSYASSYTVTDSYGRCLAVGAPDAGSSVDLQQWSTIVSETCSAATRQKWNAPASIADSGLRDTTELN